MPGTLAYNPRTPLFHRRNFRRLFVAALVLLTFIIPAYYFRQEFVRRYHRYVMLHYQQQCLAYSLPAGTLVYSDDPTDIARVAGTSDYSRFVFPRVPSSFYVIHKIPPLNSFSEHLSGSAPSAFIYGSLENHILVHALTSPTGERRLVILEACSNLLPFDDREVYFSATFAPIHQFFGPSDLPARQLIRLPLSQPSPARPHKLRLFAPQFDDTNPSRFTITYEYLNVPGEIEGHFTTDTAGAPSINSKITGGPLDIDPTDLLFHTPSTI